MLRKNCPRCHQPISEERLRSLPTICDSCGFSVSSIQHHANDQKFEERNRNLVIGISVGVLVLFFHLATWGSYSLEVRLLQTRHILGLGSIKSLDRMVAICTELKYYDCIEGSYARQARIDARFSSRHAEFLMTRHKFAEAAQSLRAYVKVAKKDPQAFTLYAMSMGEIGKIDEAAKYYEYALAAQGLRKTDLVQSYVKHLTRAKRYAEAQSVILRARKANKPNFMDSEFRVISEMQARKAPASTAPARTVAAPRPATTTHAQKLSSR